MLRNLSGSLISLYKNTSVSFREVAELDDPRVRGMPLNMRKLLRVHDFSLGLSIGVWGNPVT